MSENTENPVVEIVYTHEGTEFRVKREIVDNQVLDIFNLAGIIYRACGGNQHLDLHVDGTPKSLS